MQVYNAVIGVQSHEISCPTLLQLCQWHRWSLNTSICQ